MMQNNNTKSPEPIHENLYHAFKSTAFIYSAVGAALLVHSLFLSSDFKQASDKSIIQNPEQYCWQELNHKFSKVSMSAAGEKFMAQCEKYEPIQAGNRLETTQLISKVEGVAGLFSLLAVGGALGARLWMRKRMPSLARQDQKSSGPDNTL